MDSMQMMGEEIIYKVLLNPWFKEEGKASPHSLVEAPQCAACNWILICFVDEYFKLLSSYEREGDAWKSECILLGLQCNIFIQVWDCYWAK